MQVFSPQDDEMYLQYAKARGGQWNGVTVRQSDRRTNLLGQGKHGWPRGFYVAEEVVL